jgi:ribosomal protein S18 acetylase RimI-like enzyme
MAFEYCYGRFSIRRNRDADLDAVIDLWQQLPGLTLRAEDSPEALQPLLLDSKLHLYVAVCESAIVGAILMGEDGRRGHLYHLAVAEPMQGLGLGRVLVDVALDELASRGITRTHVFVQIDNAQAQSFWAHLGWQVRADLAVYTQDAVGARDAG